MTETAPARRARIAAEREAAIAAVVEALRALTKKTGRVHDFLSDAIEGGRLTESDIPDDYEAFVFALEKAAPAYDKAREAIAAYDAAKGQE